MPETKVSAVALDTIYASLPEDKVDAVATATVVCAASAINAGMTEDEAADGLRRVMSKLRERGAGEVLN